MSRRARVIWGLVALAATSLGPVAAEAGILLQSDRYAYTGTVTQYGSLSDAINNVNPGTVYQLPTVDVSIRARVDAAPDLTTPGQSTSAFYFVPNYAIPQFNQNYGFVQIADANGSTIQTSDALFNPTGDAFGIFVAGSNAQSGSQFARLGFSPAMNGQPGIVTQGVFHQYEFDAIYSGLIDYTKSSQTGGVGLAGNETKTIEKAGGGANQDILGIFHGIFQNTNPLDPSYNGFYSVDLILSNQSVGFSGFGLSGSDAEGCFGVTSSSFSPAETPEPGTVVLSAIGGLVALAFGRRRSNNKSA